MSSWPAFNLTAAAAFVALADLVWGRTAARLLLPHNALSAGINAALMNVSGFVSQLCGVLALGLFVVALANDANRRALFPRALGVSLLFIAVVFVLLSGRALLGPVGGRALLYVKVAYGFLSFFFLMGLWRRTLGSSLAFRLTLGTTMFAAPGVLAAAASFIDRATGLGAGVATTLNRAGEFVALAAGLLAAPLLAPRRRDLRKAAWFAAASAASVLAIAVVFAGLLERFDLLQTLAAYGFNLEVPPWSASGSGIYMATLALAAGSVVFALVTFAGTRGPLRLVGYGLVLVLAGGYHPTNPGLLATSLVGLVAVALGISRLPRAVNAAHEQSGQQPQGPRQNMDPSQDNATPAS